MRTAPMTERTPHMTSSRRIALATFVLAVGATGVEAACSAPGSSPPPNNIGGGSSSGGGSGGGSSSGTMSNGPIALPFNVSDQFIPSGFMGDAPTDFNAVKMTSDAAQCPTRQAGAKGNCYKITWTPQRVGDASTAWVGVYWQYPSNNWGAKAGKAISPGASKVTFLASGGAGGEEVEFLAGGVNITGGMPNLTYADTFQAKTNATLTTTWAPYEISLSGDSYSSVIGAFAWTITTSSTSPITFYVDNIQWE
jgi:hypothetical protein